MMINKELESLVTNEIADIYAGLLQPGEPETIEESQKELTQRVLMVIENWGASQLSDDALGGPGPVEWQFKTSSGKWLSTTETGKNYAVFHGYEVRPLFCKPVPAAPVAVPDMIQQRDAPELQEIAAEAERLGIKGAYGAFAVGANWMRSKVLRLNSGSKSDD